MSNFTKRKKANKTYIIAEAGSNHNGKIDTALDLVKIAADCKADCIKFQSVTFDSLTNDYKNLNLKKAVDLISLNKEWYFRIKEECDKNKIDFTSTPIYNQAVNDLISSGVPFIKIASMDLTNIPFLRFISKKQIPVVISRGMSHLHEIEIAIDALNYYYQNNITLLHCIANYPTQPKNLNLNQIKSLINTFDIPIGFSDHTESTSLPAVAVTLGAKMIEKHFTYNRNVQGFDHFYSLEPKELKEMIRNIRDAEAAMGSSKIKISDSEKIDKKLYQRSIIVNKDLDKNHIIKQKDLTTKRPGNGISPIYWDQIIGMKSNKKLKKNNLLNWSDVK